MKRIFSLFVCLFAYQFLCAQSTGFLRYSMYGLLEKIYPVAGNCFITTGQDGTNNARMVTKWDQNFNMIWCKTFNQLDFYSFRDMVVLHDGNYAFLTSNSQHNGCGAVVKMDPNGNVLFQKEYYFNGNFLSLFSIGVANGASDYGYVLGGGACASNNFLVKCDASGNVTWAKEYNDFTAAGVKTAFAIVPNGTGYLVASDELSGTTTDATVMRVDGNGNFMWFKQFNIPGTLEIPRRMTKLANGQLAILCTDDANNTPDVIYFLDTAATNVTYKSYSTPNDMFIRDFIDDGSANLYAVGMDYTSMTVNTRLYMKLDYSGNIVWQKYSNGTAASTLGMFHAIAKAPSGNFAIAGGLNGSGIGQTISVIDASGNGMCVDQNGSVTASVTGTLTVTPKTITATSITVSVASPSYTVGTLTLTRTLICGTVSTNDIEAAGEQLSLYPNPGNESTVNIASENGLQQANIRVLNVSGQLIKEVADCNGEQYSLDVSGLSGGLYLIEVQQGEHIARLKLIRN